MSTPPKTEVLPEDLPLLTPPGLGFSLAPTYHGVRSAVAARAAAREAANGMQITPAQRRGIRQRAGEEVAAALRGQQLFSVAVGGRLWTRGARLHSIEVEESGLVAVIRRTATNTLVRNDGAESSSGDATVVAGLSLRGNRIFHPGAAPTRAHVGALLRWALDQAGDLDRVAAAILMQLHRDFLVSGRITEQGLLVMAPRGGFVVPLRGQQTLSSR